MLFQERELVPISSLEYDLIVLHMEKTASAKSERIFPFQYGPLSVFEDIYHEQTIAAGENTLANISYNAAFPAIGSLAT